MIGIFRRRQSVHRTHLRRHLGRRAYADLRQVFDVAHYLRKNPDVAAAGTDPLDHFLDHGWREGRDPGAAAAALLKRYPGLADIEEAPAAAQGAGTEAETLSDEDRARVAAAFDCDFYRAQHGDVSGRGLDPLDHFLRHGWREGRDPAPDFSVRYYLDVNPDIREGGRNPFVHWVLHGRAEGRPGQPPQVRLSDEDRARVADAFDERHYLLNNIDVSESGADPLDHFLRHGWREGRDPGPDFSVRYYLDANPDIRDSGQNPFVHWVLHGRDEGRPGTAPRLGANIDEDRIDWHGYDPEDHAAIASEFDRAFYLSEHPDVAERDLDPVAHYLLAGWHKRYDPTPDFSTRFYLDRYRDLRNSGQNPFVHYCRFGRDELRETQSYVDRARRGFRPLVSVIVPNYNHAPYLPRRIASIAAQSYDRLEIIILDDRSSDDSREVIRRTVAELGIEAQLVFNEENSGNVFAQWRKGMELATGDLVWICESDDFCEPDFLEHLVPAFAEESVNIAFGRIQFASADGTVTDWLDTYREGAEPGIWDETCLRPAREWFDNAFGVNNVIANVGGCLFRRVSLPEAVWEQARSFRICGDWYLYIHLAGAGQILYEPRSVAYFRQHDGNTSARNFHRRYYYEENMAILAELVRQWGIRVETRRKFLGKVRAQYDHLKVSDRIGDFDETFGTAALLAAGRERPHVQLHFLGFHIGGGELFPINLANAFLEAGFTVSMLAVEMSQVDPGMRARLDRRVPVYHGTDLLRGGRAEYLEAAGVSVINSHVASSDVQLAQAGSGPIEVPWVVTLHGSYVGLEQAPPPLVDWILENVSTWIYTADRNLEFFAERDVDWDSFVKLPNAMPRDPTPAPFARADLGIAPGDTVFMLIARGIKRKGWRAAIEAFRRLHRDRGRTATHLLLIGEGEATDAARKLAEGLGNVHFLGTQSAINGLLRLSDCLILPTRFEGESYPLCLIQAIQEHVPTIATDIGEIRAMMTEDKAVAGILLENRRDSRAFFADLTDAMERMCDPAVRKGFAAVVEARARIFDIDSLVNDYAEIFEAARRTST